MLRGKDSGYPAETYAGTATGLCYPCTSKQPFVAARHALDGALSVSHPPHAPSWRGDREKFTAYADCVACDGLGRSWRDGAYGQRYPVQCQPCFDRFWTHPMRKWASDRERRIHDSAQHLYEAALKQAKLVKLVKQGKVSQDRLDAIRKPILARYERARDRWACLRASRRLDETVAP